MIVKEDNKVIEIKKPGKRKKIYTYNTLSVADPDLELRGGGGGGVFIF